MKFLTSAACLVLLALSHAAAQNASTNTSTTDARPSPVSPQEPKSVTNSVQDDLGWLIGRWKCVTRQYIAARQSPMGGPGEDALDYFNVYLPYADDHLTLALTDEPNDRPISAEFLVRSVAWPGPFAERLIPMPERGPVRIGRNRILYGNRPFEDYEFRYSVEQRGPYTWLKLESKSMRLELFKLPSEIGDVRQSQVAAPLKEYTPDRLANLRRQYAQLCARAKQ